MNISAPFIARPVATFLLMLDLFAAGVVGYDLLPVAAMPEVAFPTLSVTPDLPGADPETMASSVAAILRFRPILMRTVAAVFITLPIAIGFGAGADLRQPLGVAVVGGLLVSQLPTLFRTPVTYLYMERPREFLYMERLRGFGLR